MKLYIRHIIHALTVMTVMLAVWSCRDHLIYTPGMDITGETVRVTLTADFMPAAEGNLLSRADGSVASPGDCMTDVNDLYIVIFDRTGKYYTYHQIKDWNTTDATRYPEDASNGVLAGETSTSQLTFDCELPLGTYYLYALANMGSGSKTTADFIESLGLIEGETTRAEFESKSRSWDTSSMINNSGMTGFFTNNKGAAPASRTADGLHGGLVTVSSAGTNLHCWLRRMASKLTITFDASGLCSDVYVYIRDVRVHNIASSSNLFGPNTAVKTEDIVPESDNTQILMFCNKEDAGAADLSDVHAHYENWPCLTAKNKSMANLTGIFPHLANYTHANDAPSLFFFENMQDKGESKLQDADFDGVVDSPNSIYPDSTHYRDNKPYGTYIEVTAYYVSRNNERLGNGTIKYRFMMGKDVIKDYDTERNYHYKLTLNLLGYANEVDWHIEYDTQHEDISIPNPCYISYSSGERLTVPILVYGDLTKAEATIVRNDWEPSIPWTDAKPKGENVYFDEDLHWMYQGTDATTGQPKKNAFGFLSLIRPHYDAIGIHIGGVTGGDANTQYLWNYWIGNGNASAGMLKQNEQRNPHYKRSYDVTTGVHGSDTPGQDGTYTVIRNADPSTTFNSTRIELPLYTRERNLVKTTGLSGANPFEAYQRRAKVKFHLEFKRGNKPITVDTIIDIIQVERIVNPAGVWRDWDNARPFQVKLSQLNGASSLSFHTLESRGSWSAEVEIGSDWILLNGRRTAISGETGTPVEFEIKPAGLLPSSDDVRCGVVLVRYHNNTCVHRIFVRQGYAPLAVNDGGTVWHTFNLVAADREGSSPLDEGSLFKFANLAQPIASINNVNDKYPWINVEPGDFLDHRDDLLEIVGSDTKLKFAQIKPGAIPEAGQTPGFNEAQDLGIPGARIMSVLDVARLRDNKDNRVRYGVCYADGATTTEVHIDQVYGYKALDSHNNYGMRGCFVYNAVTGAQIFFPIGSSGYGGRSSDGSAKVKYSGPGAKLSVGGTRPLLYYLYRSQGAIYWAGQKVVDEVSNLTGRTDLDKDGVGMDINYFSYDFNTIQNGSTFTMAETGAYFIRLVEKTE